MPWLLWSDWSVLPRNVWHRPRRVRLRHARLRVWSLLRRDPRWRERYARFSIATATSDHQCSDICSHQCPDICAHQRPDIGAHQRPNGGAQRSPIPYK